MQYFELAAVSARTSDFSDRLGVAFGPTGRPNFLLEAARNQRGVMFAPASKDPSVVLTAGALRRWPQATAFPPRLRRRPTVLRRGVVKTILPQNSVLRCPKFSAPASPQTHHRPAKVSRGPAKVDQPTCSLSSAREIAGRPSACRYRPRQMLRPGGRCPSDVSIRNWKLKWRQSGLSSQASRAWSDPIWPSS